jgi:hypothetical protein
MSTNARQTIVDLLRRHLGADPISTLSLGRPNWVARVDAEYVWVETEKSKRERTGPQPIPIDWIADAYEVLTTRKVLTREDLTTKSSKRSAFIFAALAQLPGVEWQDRPIELRLVDQLGDHHG